MARRKGPLSRGTRPKRVGIERERKRWYLGQPVLWLNNGEWICADVVAIALSTYSDGQGKSTTQTRLTIRIVERRFATFREQVAWPAELIIGRRAIAAHIALKMRELHVESVPTYRSR